MVGQKLGVHRATGCRFVVIFFFRSTEQSFIWEGWNQDKREVERRVALPSTALISYNH